MSRARTYPVPGREPKDRRRCDDATGNSLLHRQTVRGSTDQTMRPGRRDWAARWSLCDEGTWLTFGRKHFETCPHLYLPAPVITVVSEYRGAIVYSYTIGHFPSAPDTESRRATRLPQDAHLARQMPHRALDGARMPIEVTFDQVTARSINSFMLSENCPSNSRPKSCFVPANDAVTLTPRIRTGHRANV
jgi:hypothetical protein